MTSSKTCFNRCHTHIQTTTTIWKQCRHYVTEYTVIHKDTSTIRKRKWVQLHAGLCLVIGDSSEPGYIAGNTR